MALHDTPGVEPHQASPTHALVVAQTSDLLMQACGLSSAPDSDPFGQIQQGESTPRRRGRPQQVSGTHLWSSLLLCALQGMHSFADWRRLLGLQSIGPFAPVWLTRNGLVKRLLQAGLVPLQDLWEGINAQLASIGSQAVPATLAPFASPCVVSVHTIQPVLPANWWVCWICGPNDGCGWNGARMSMRTAE